MRSGVVQVVSRPGSLLALGVGLSIASAIAGFEPIGLLGDASPLPPVPMVSTIGTSSSLHVTPSDLALETSAEPATLSQLSARLADHRAARQHALALQQNARLWTNAAPSASSVAAPQTARQSIFLPIADATNLTVGRELADRPVHVTDVGSIQTFSRADSIVAQAIAFQGDRSNNRSRAPAIASESINPHGDGITLVPDKAGNLHEVAVGDEAPGTELVLPELLSPDDLYTEIPVVDGAGIDMPYDVGSSSGLFPGGETGITEGDGLLPGQVFPDHELYIGDNNGGYTVVTPEPTTLASASLALTLLRRRRA